VKAYQSSVKMGLETLPLCERMVASYIDVTLEHRFITQLQRMLPDFRASVVSQDFGMDATFTLKLPEASIAPLTKILVDLTAGGVLIEEKEKPAGR
jgi:putative IMPACT (imprinted ancient) family translation regulator